MRSILGGAVAAIALGLGVQGCGSPVPAHPSCHLTSDCPSGDACHIPEGFDTGFCVLLCTTASSCPSPEPECVSDTNGSAPFDFCGCLGIGPDAGYPAPGCGAVNGYSCNVEARICTAQ